MRSKLTTLAILAILMALAFGLLAWINQQNHNNLLYPYLEFSVDESLKVAFLKRPTRSVEACQSDLARMRAELLSNCEKCRIVEASCARQKPRDLENLLTENSLGFPTARIAMNTEIAFRANNDQMAFEMCKLTQAQSMGAARFVSIQCFPSNMARPFPQQEQTAIKESQTASNALQYLGAALGGFVLLMTAWLVAKSVIYRKITGDIPAGRLPVKLLLAAGDALILAGMFIVLRFPAESDFALGIHVTREEIVAHLALMSIAIGAFWVMLEHYYHRRPFWDELRDILGMMSGLLAVSIILGMAINSGNSAGTGHWVWLLGMAMIPMGRAFLRQLLDVFGLWEQPVVLVGCGPNAKQALQALDSEPAIGFRVLALIEPDASRIHSGRMHHHGARAIPVLPLAEDIAEQIRQFGEPQIVVALESLTTPESQSLVQHLVSLQRDIHIIPALRGLPLFGTRLSHFFSHEALFLTVRNNLYRRTYRWIKRCFDIVLSITLLLMLFPLLLGISVCVGRDGGPRFFPHLRIGRGGREFPCWKFRTMKVDAEQLLEAHLRDNPADLDEWTRTRKLKSDPRVTAVGQLLRRSSLDELPQLLNVLRGDMSFVGPRPIVKPELAMYGNQAQLYLQVRPGMTGLWQISGRNDVGYDERVALDTWYIQNWSLWYDIVILCKTIKVILSGKGAY